MVDFKFYLNRQGVRGQRGEKGDTGFSPLITEKTNTKEEYVLHIQNETDDTSFDTPNLKEGLVPEDMGGTYVRLNRETGNQYYGDIEEATETTKGVVKLEPDETVLTPTSETSVITAEQAVQNYTKKTETQDLQNIVTANSGDIDKLQDMEYVSSVGVYGSDLTVQKSKNGVITTNATIPLPTGSGDVTADGDNRFTGDNTFVGKVNITGGVLTVDGVAALNQVTATYLNATSISSSGEINAVSVKANGLRSDDIQTTENKKYLTELDVDNQTIQVINGKLHANLDELGNEVNDLSGRVTANEADISTMKTSLSMKQTKLTAGSNITLTDLTDGTVRIDSTGGGGTGDVPIATTTTAGKVKPDGTTITITDDGTISAVGGGSAPTNMVTTDTEQEISGQKTFTYLGSSFDGYIYPSLKINQLTIGQTGAITPASAFQSSSSLTFYVNNSTKALSMGADETSNTFTLTTIANKLTIGSDGKIVLSAGDQGTLTIDNGVKFKDYYQNEYDLLNATPAVIDGGDSTTV
jgi:hypothetical protein